MLSTMGGMIVCVTWLLYKQPQQLPAPRSLRINPTMAYRKSSEWKIDGGEKKQRDKFNIKTSNHPENRSYQCFQTGNLWSYFWPGFHPKVESDSVLGRPLVVAEPGGEGGHVIRGWDFEYVTCRLLCQLSSIYNLLRSDGLPFKSVFIFSDLSSVWH